MQAPPCHACYDVPAWLLNQTDVLQTAYTYECEPYIITMSDAAPRYDERFRGYHNNKVTFRPLLLFNRNIGYVTPEIIYFHYLIKSSLDQRIQKKFYSISKTDALRRTESCLIFW